MRKKLSQWQKDQIEMLKSFEFDETQVDDQDRILSYDFDNSKKELKILSKRPPISMHPKIFIPFPFSK